MSDSDDGFVFGGKISKAPTQIISISDVPKAQTFAMMESTKNVKTKAESSAIQRAQSDGIEMFRNHSDGSNPGSSNEAVTKVNTISFVEPVIVRPKKSAKKDRKSRNNSDNDNENRHGDLDLCSKLGKCSSISLLCSLILGFLFAVVSILTLTSFEGTECNAECVFTNIPSEHYYSIINEKLTGLSTDECSYVIAYHDKLIENQAGVSEYSWKGLQSDYESNTDNIKSMYLAHVSGTAFTFCFNSIPNNDNIINKYIPLNNKNEFNHWDMRVGLVTWNICVCISVSLLFMFTEWLYYSYHKYTIPKYDTLYIIKTYFIRIGLMSFMFTLIITHSLLIKPNNNSSSINYLIGQIDYSWIRVNLLIGSVFFGIILTICAFFCCMCLSPDSGGSNNYDDDDNDCCPRLTRKTGIISKCLWPYSRIKSKQITNDEAWLGSILGFIFIFSSLYIILGILPFIHWIRASFNSHTHFPWIASIWFLSMMVMTGQLFWDLRIHICKEGDSVSQNIISNGSNEGLR